MIWTKLASWRERRKRAREKEEILDRDGMVMFCPDCRHILNDDEYVAPCTGDPAILRCEYTCSQCGRASKWAFGIAPVPLLCEGDYAHLWLASEET